MSKTKDEPKYKNIPVRPDVYEQVQLISEANGFGARGMGAQVAQWAARELPECGHEKTLVEIEYFSNSELPGLPPKRTGYFCATCNRVYAHIEEEAVTK